MNLNITAAILKLLWQLHNQSEQGKLTGHTKYRTPPHTTAHCADMSHIYVQNPKKDLPLTGHTWARVLGLG